MSGVEPRFIPCLLLSAGQLVKTRRFSEPCYVGDPINVLSIFSSFEVDEIVLLDIDATHRGTPPPLSDLRRFAEECFIPLAYGGGLRTLEDVHGLFSVGYEKAVVNSLLAEDPALVQVLSAQFGRQAIVASVDVREVGAKRSVHVRGGSVDTGVDPVEWCVRAADLGVGEILLTDIDREGTLEGYDLELVGRVTAAVDVPVIAHGGAGRRDDLAKPVLEAGASASAAGSLFVFQRSRGSVLINYPTRAQIARLLKTTVVADDDR